MTINISTQGIHIGSFLLSENEGGIQFDGVVTSKQQIDHNYFVGSDVGFTSGGYTTPPATFYNTIDRFPFANNVNAIDVGDLTQSRSGSSGQVSDAFGYTSGGTLTAPYASASNVIDRFPFATYSNASDVGDQSLTTHGSSGQSSPSHGYMNAGAQASPTSPYGSYGYVYARNKFSFANNENGVVYASMLSTVQQAGHSSDAAGYASGGTTAPIPTFTYSNSIAKFSFATDVFSGSVGSLTQGKSGIVGHSSFTNGYVSGGGVNPSYAIINTIERFPFSTNANAVDTTDLSIAVIYAAGQSSKDSGYVSGGSTPGATNTIQKFPFASDSNSIDVADLTVARILATGVQD